MIRVPQSHRDDHNQAGAPPDLDGAWLVENFENLNPADTREVVGIFQKSGKDDVDQAVDAAKHAFRKWRLVPAPRRAEIVFRAAEILIVRK